MAISGEVAIVERWPLLERWPLWRGGHCREVVVSREVAVSGEVAIVERWLLVER